MPSTSNSRTRHNTLPFSCFWVIFAGMFLLICAHSACAQVPASSHIILVIDENHPFNDVIAQMPWLVNQGNMNGYATNYHSDSGGSLLDYLWLASGSCHTTISTEDCPQPLPAGTNDFSCTGGGCPSEITDDNIFREMNARGITWKVYAQSYAAASDNGVGDPTAPDNNNNTSYYRRHNGATWYSDILDNVNPDGSNPNVVDFSQFATDLANDALPTFVIIVPDGDNDAHDGSLADADNFLKSNLDPMLAKPYFQPGGDGLLIVTFDECGGGNNTDNNCAAQVYTAVIGPNVSPNTVSSTPYKHENTLRTILDAMGITTYPGASASASDMSDFFSGNQDITVSMPAPNATLSSPFHLVANSTSCLGQPTDSMAFSFDDQQDNIFSGAKSIDTSASAGNGPHILRVKAWGTSGSFCEVDRNITIGSGDITVSSPAPNATLSSPFHLVANSTSCLGQPTDSMAFSFDDQQDNIFSGAKSIDTSASASNGSHILRVKAWGTSGSFCEVDRNITIGP